MSKKEITAAANDGVMPKATVGRLSLYLRQLEALLRAGRDTVSSNELGQSLEITDAQVRKDLTYFGQFGYPGIGYRVVELREALRGVLGTNRTWSVALVGVGNLGRALLGYRGFRDRGFDIAAVFDRSPALVGQQIGGLTVHDVGDLPEVARRLNLELAVLAVPAEAAVEAAEAVRQAGIVGILNFAPVPLKVPEVVSVVSVDLGLQLEQLAYQVTQRSAPGCNGKGV